MATASYLNAPVNRAAEVFVVSSIAGAVVGGYIRVDDEFAIITELAGQAVTVRSRGSFGGSASAHPARAPVTFGALNELLVNPRGKDISDATSGSPWKQASLGADGDVPLLDVNEDTEFRITKATAAALVLNAHALLAQEGLRIRFVANVPAAHTIRIRYLPNQPGIGYDTITMNEALGATVEYQAVRSVWVPVLLTQAYLGPAAMGTSLAWVQVPYNAADFSAPGAAWDTIGPNNITVAYLLFSPTVMCVSVVCARTTITVDAIRVRVRIPGGRTIAQPKWTTGRLCNGVDGPVPFGRETHALVGVDFPPTYDPTVIEIAPISMTTEKLAPFLAGRLDFGFQIMLDLLP